MNGIFRWIVASAVVGIASGCAALPSTTSRPEMAYVSPTLKRLQQLPAPLGKIVVAVYGFRDQTGQYKPNPAGTSFSTAVTQGGASMLVQSLKRSNWFVPVEREGLNNVLTERKIIHAAKGEKVNAGKSGEAGAANSGPSPLVPASLVIDGGIIAYDTNLVTGGVGAKYVGSGGSLEFRSDQVTVYLRAINVETGEIIDSVSVSKTILSQQVDIGVFKFVSVERLLELEAGFSANEPPQQCVQEAIDKAVFALIVNGIVNGHWGLKNPSNIDMPVIRSYLEEIGVKTEKVKKASLAAKGEV